MPRDPIPEEYRGVRFRQIAPALRWSVGEGLAHQEESKRARDPDTNQFLDVDGTFVTFDDDARIDLVRLIERGHLVRDDEPKGKSKAAAPLPPAEGEGVTSSG